MTLPQLLYLHTHFSFVQETRTTVTFSLHNIDRQRSLFIHVTGSALARLCAVHVCVFANTFPGYASFGASAHDNFCTLGLVASRWEQVSRCPLTIPLSLVVVEEVECYMLRVSTPLTSNELVECAIVAHYL